MVGPKTHYFESKILPYRLIFRLQVEEIECDILFFCEIHFLVQNQKKKVYFISKSYSRIFSHTQTYGKSMVF